MSENAPVTTPAAEGSATGAAASVNATGANGKPKTGTNATATTNGSKNNKKNGTVSKPNQKSAAGAEEVAEVPEDPSIAAITNAVATLKAAVNKGSSCENLKKNAKKVVELGEGNVAKALKNGKTKENSLKNVTKTIQETIKPITNACKGNAGPAPAVPSKTEAAPASVNNTTAAPASTNAAAPAVSGNASGGARKSKRKSRKSKRKTRKSQSRRRR
jgi:hypothetical protein